MPNSVKYNTESEANALTIGNMHIGTGDIPKGPTSSTGFYNGINPPNGGYAIYIHKTTEGSSILLPTNDAELIVITNQIAGASYTTVNECFSYFAGQSGKFVLHSPINFMVTDGLVLNLSANILPSYPRSGTSWKDLSGESNNGVLTNSPTFDSNGWFDFDGVDDRVNISNSSNINISDNFTFSILVKSSTWTSGNQEGLVQKGGISNYGAYLRGGGGTVSFYTTPTFYWAPGPNIGGDGKWHYLTFIYSYSQLGYKQVYHNGSYHAQIAVTVPINSNNSDINIGYAGVGSPQYLNAEVANYKLYNKVLSPTEILQNYNSLLGSYFRPANSASEIMSANPEAESGTYWINTNLGPQLLYCILDPAVQGGGWMGVNENIAPYTGNVATTAVWEDNNNYLESSNTSVLNVTIQEIGCSGTSYYQLGNPSDQGINYSSTMMLMYRVSTLGQCSSIGGGTTGYYDGQNFTGNYTSAGMCTWNDGNFANECCGAQNMTGLKPYWVMFTNGTNKDLEYSTRCAGGNGTHYHMWFVK